MKCVFMSLSLVVALVMAMHIGNVDAQRNRKCSTSCTYELIPVCGFNGACYQEFSNKCQFNVEQCKRKNLRQVNMSLCRNAMSGRNSRVRRC